MLRSSTYSPRPRRKRRTSRRSIDVPINVFFTVNHPYRRRAHRARPRRTRHTRSSSRVMPRARHAPERRLCRRDHARRTDAALESMMFAEARLQGREALILRQPFDRDDFAALGLDGQYQTAADSLAVDQHGAGTAHSVLATDMRAGQPQMMAQAIRKRQARFDRNLNRAAIHLEASFHGVCSAAILRARSTMVPASALR